MEISINTPALLFPAITLLMLAYTNRFLAIASLIRSLYAKTKSVEYNNQRINEQLANLRIRLKLIKNMQLLGVISFIFCVLCMALLFVNYTYLAIITFGLSLICLLISLLISFKEIAISTHALEIELKDMES